jgi:transcriptional regulator with XRE-family HTH domain
MKTGELIKQLRLKKGITQEELASRTDISVRTIQRIENGEVDPRAYTLQSIASALEVEFEVLAASESVPGSGSTAGDGSKWLAVMHLSGLLLLIIPPVILWIWKRDEVENMQKHAYDVINFQLSITLYLIPCVLFSIYPVLVVLIVYSQAMVIINTVRVTNRQEYKYPLTIRFLKAGKPE